MGLTEFLHHSMEWIAQSGWSGVVWFVILYTLTCVFFLPGSVSRWSRRCLRFLV